MDKNNLDSKHNFYYLKKIDKALNSVEDLIKILNTSHKEASDDGKNDILIDMREASLQISFMDEYSMITNLLSITSLTKENNVAIIGRMIPEGSINYNSKQPSEERARFAEKVSQNWNQNIFRCFPTEALAIKWLKSVSKAQF